MTNSKENDGAAEGVPTDTEVAETDDLRIQLSISDRHASTLQTHNTSANARPGQSPEDLTKQLAKPAPRTMCDTYGVDEWIKILVFGKELVN
ncbi:hypothetical protein PRZ48_005788 [Zasmidium cellare]|uniref:Uncharacterized protein n=1 Tax=Zasmidium cellare TaxID=395010 RepID=A0ABR0EMK9_ZASCE|nr:hypothetical protein PRZ48_005788 [Zasmidium cellare]